MKESQSEPKVETHKTVEAPAVELKNKVPTKGERIKEIFDLLASLPSFRNQKEAYEGLEKAFEQVEEKYYPEFVSAFQESGPSDDVFKMRVNRINRYLNHGDAKIGLIRSEKNYTFIGKNGAIEIQMREGNSVIDKNPGNKVIFQKLGANGKGVWE